MGVAERSGHGFGGNAERAFELLCCGCIGDETLVAHLGDRNAAFARCGDIAPPRPRATDASLACRNSFSPPGCTQKRGWMPKAAPASSASRRSGLSQPRSSSEQTTSRPSRNAWTSVARGNASATTGSTNAVSGVCSTARRLPTRPRRRTRSRIVRISRAETSGIAAWWSPHRGRQSRGASGSRRREMSCLTVGCRRRRRAGRRDVPARGAQTALNA